MKNVLMTFDYELFLGQRSGTIMKCLIEPTNRLLKTFEQNGIKNTIFFIDTTYLLKLENHSNQKSQENLQVISNQLIEIFDKGHYVFPHIHPHWKDAKYIEEIDQWDLSDIRKYKFANLNQVQIDALFDKSIELLSKILNIEKSSFDSYRAGGWSIQPFEKVKSSFLKYGIFNDMSVAPGKKVESSLQSFDFLQAPMLPYHFSEDPSLLDNHGDFKEYPISVLNQVSKFSNNKLLMKINWRIGGKSFGDGIGAGAVYSKSFGSEKLMLSLDQPVFINWKYIKKYVDENSYLHFISHPKLLSEISFKWLEKVISVLKNEGSEFDFRKY